MPSQYNMLLLPLKDMEENLEELLTRCRKLRQNALIDDSHENRDTSNAQEEGANFCSEDTWISHC